MNLWVILCICVINEFIGQEGKGKKNKQREIKEIRNTIDPKDSVFVYSLKEQGFEISIKTGTKGGRWHLSLFYGNTMFTLFPF